MANSSNGKPDTRTDAEIGKANSEEPEPTPYERAAEEFLEKATDPAPEDHFVSTAELVAAAQGWAMKQGELVVGARALARQLRLRGATQHSTGQQRGWRGVRLR